MRSTLISSQPQQYLDRSSKRRRLCLNATQHDAMRVTVIGGGAAGLTAAYFAAKNGAQVTVLEKMPEAGKKILISGGKRCNVLPDNIELDRDYFTDSSKSALRAVFSRWSLDACHSWLEDEIRLPLAYEPETCKYFPKSNSAKEVRDKLLEACKREGARVRFHSSMKKLGRSDDKWQCTLEDDTVHTADRVVIATGGQSFPALGTTGTGFKVLQQLGHSLSQVYPALTPLKGTHIAAQQLAGISMYNVQVQCAQASAGKKKRATKAAAERSAMLFTHKGFSGPAILDLSHHVVRAVEQNQPPPGLKVNWASKPAAFWEEQLCKTGASAVDSILKQNGIPARLAEALTTDLSISSRPVAQLTKSEAQGLVKHLVSYTLACNGHEGYAKAEVTGGGVTLNDTDCATLESRWCPGLFMCGEVLDVFGRIGGFNFYWAWLTGKIAGTSASEQC